MTAKGPALPQKAFDHVGIPTAEVREGATLLPEDGVLVTNPRQHPLNIEWVHHLPESRMPDRFKKEIHVAYRVPELKPYLKAYTVLQPAFTVPASGVEIAFVEIDGVIVELLSIPETNKEEWVA